MPNNSRKILAISLLSIPLSAGAALVPVLSDINAAFPDKNESIQFLVTLPPLFMMFSSLLTDKLSQKIPFKLISAISIFIITFAGISPYWIDGFGYLLFTRALMGIGLGLLNTVTMSLPALYFDNSKTRDFAVGIQSAFVCAGGILFNVLSGVLAKYSWKDVFLVQILNILPLLAAIFMMPDVKNDVDLKSKKQKLFVKNAMPIVTIAFITIILTCTYPLNLSMFVENQNIGNSQFVGLLAGINSAIGFFIGLIFGQIYSKTKNFTLPIGMTIVSAALFIVTFSQNQTVMLIGSVCFGIGTSFVSPSLYSIMYTSVKPEEVVASAAMLGVASNVSQFVSPFIINPIANFVPTDNIEGSRFVLTGGLVLIMAVILFVKNKPISRNNK